MNFVPRKYQLDAHELMVAGFKEQLRLLVLMPTGTGKTKTMISFMEKFKQYYNFVVIVRQRDLVFQFAEAIDEFENIDYAVVMSGHPKYDPKKSIQICSIDTLSQREIYPHVNDPKDLIILIDEADESNSDKYQVAINRYTRRHLAAYPNHFTADMIKKMRGAFLAGFTATAFDDPLPHFDKVIQPITPDQALEIGALVDFEYIIPDLIDLEGIRVQKGEFNAHDADIKMNTDDMVKFAFEKWLVFGENRQTLIFASSQEHANRIVKYINGFYNQEMAKVITAEIDSSVRKKHYQDFKNGKIRFLVNIRIITRGVDIPEIGCILDLALTKKINLHIQKLGRGSRPNPIYKNCLIIDVANNCVRNGPFYKWPRMVNLKEKRKRGEVIPVPEMDICGKCFRAHIRVMNQRKCPYCETPYEVKEKKLTKAEQKKFEMQSASPEKIKQLKMINDFKMILWKKKNLKDQYRNNIDSPRDRAHDEMVKKYGLVEVLKVKNAIMFDEGKWHERQLKIKRK